MWCITGGSPCQDLSIAGKRAGLAGARSGLFMEQVRIVKEMREADKRNGRTGDMVRPRYLPEGATLGSLFDGIGGFPLIWERIHGKSTARWASEIEPFPIAVTKKHFPEEKWHDKENS